MALLKTIMGWNPWSSLNTHIKEYDVCSAPFIPSYYLPSRSFRAYTYATHCDLTPPWAFDEDLFSAFLRGGGISGTLMGSMTGLAIVGIILADPNVGNWGIGYNYNSIPTVGFCMGDKYKENSYFHYQITKPAFLTHQLRSDACIDVFQRSRLKRIYVTEGFVVNFRSNPNPIVSSSGKKQFILTLDLDGAVPPGIESVENDPITFYKKDKTKFHLKILKLLPNWEIIVEKFFGESDPNPESGDFYQLEKPWCIEDPFMMSGFWWGVQGEQKNTDGFPDSPYKAYKTSHNIPYNEIKFTGTYIYKNKKSGNASLTSAGIPFGETENDTWAWFKYSGVNSVIYGTEANRYFESQTVGTTNYEIKTFPTANSSDITNWKALENVTFIRMEINNGGSAQLHNWHAPILTKCFFKQNGKYFAILGQPLGNVIDIALKDVTNKINLDTSAGSGGSIFNQYAWMVNEHYGEFFGGDQVGFFEGKIISKSWNKERDETEIIVQSNGWTDGTIIQNVNFSPSYLITNSFYDRFAGTFNSSKAGGNGANLKKMWKKFWKWKIWDEKNSVFEIIENSLIIPSTVSTQNANHISGPKMTVKVYGNMSSSKTAGIYFDEPYKRKTTMIMRLPLCTYDFQPSTDGLLPEICVNNSYQTPEIVVDLTPNTIAGVTGGKYWGLGAYGLKHVFSENGLPLYVTVPAGAKGISSFFHNIIEEDWIIYQDNENRVTIRTGSLNFRDRPRKSDICIGFSESFKKVDGNYDQINFDTNKDRVKLIEINTNGIIVNPTDDFGPSALTWFLGNKNNYFGFASTGSGVFEFVPLRKNGHAKGSVDYSKYKFDNQFVSPIYIYTNQGIKRSILEMGVSTELKIMGPQSIITQTKEDGGYTIEYIKDEQNLSLVTYFDGYLLPDGEIILLYGEPTNNFIKDNTEKTAIFPRKWATTECVYAIGSANKALLWGTPIVKDLKYSNNLNYQYPVMLLNSCEYKTSFYNSVGEYFGIIMRCYHDKNKSFYGCFTVNKNTLAMGLTHCDSNYRPFWIRQSYLPEDILTNANRSYTEKDSVIYKPLTEEQNPNGIQDGFSRIIGPSGTYCDITSDIYNEIGYMTATTLSEGMAIILFAYPQGIGLMSTNAINKWAMSKIILARDAISPLIIKSSVMTNLFYITSQGIMVKLGAGELIYQASLATENAGYDSKTIERIQRDLDNAKTILIGSGLIFSQRISGYMSNDGICKVFYYNNSNILCCLESSDYSKWNMGYNF